MLKRLKKLFGMKDKNMMHWEETININHLHNLYSDGKINVVQMAKAVVSRMKSTQYWAISDPDFIDIMTEFDAMNEFSSHEDYCIALDYLFEYGDIDNRLWIETELPAKPEVIAEDDRAINFKFRMLDDYEMPTIPEDSLSIIRKPAYYNAPVHKALPAKSTVQSCGNPINKYGNKTKWRYLSQDDLNKRYIAKGIKPADIPKELNDYVKDADDQYQDWVLSRFVENANGPITPRKAPIGLGE